MERVLQYNIKNIQYAYIYGVHTFHVTNFKISVIYHRQKRKGGNIKNDNRAVVKIIIYKLLSCNKCNKKCIDYFFFFIKNRTYDLECFEHGFLKIGLC